MHSLRSGIQKDLMGLTPLGWLLQSLGHLTTSHGKKDMFDAFVHSAGH